MLPLQSRSSSLLSLLCCLGLLAGCGGSQPASPDDEFTFTERDVERFRELVQSAESGTESAAALASVSNTLSEAVPEETGPVFDLSRLDTYSSLRAEAAAESTNVYRVTNEFLNVRDEPRVTAAAVGRLERGEVVSVLDFADAAWAHVRLQSGEEGFVALRYIAKLVPEERLTEEKAAFDGLYFVDFGFLNVRKAADTTSEKLGELPGQAIIRPLHVGDVWARVLYEGKEGYVAMEYLSPFSPSLLVRQDTYRLPILHYRVQDAALLDAMAEHLQALKTAGYSATTLRAFYDLLLRQEEKDVRLPPRQVLLMITVGETGDVMAVSDALQAAGVTASVFLQTDQVGISGVTEKQLLTLVANGLDIQSATHTGDDLRSLTNAQLELELAQSRSILEELIGQPVFAVAYPLGGVNQRVVETAAAAGYLFGVGAAPEGVFTRQQFLQLPSFPVNELTTADEVLSLVGEGV